MYPRSLFIFRTILASSVFFVYPRHCLYSEQYLLLQFYLCTPDIVYIQNNTCFFSFTCVPQTLFIFRTILSSSVLLVYPRHCLYSEQYLLLQFYLCTPDHCLYSEQYLLLQFYLCTPDIVYIQNNTCFFSFTCVPQTLFIIRTILASSVLLVYPRHFYIQNNTCFFSFTCVPQIIVYIQNNTCFFSFFCVPQTLFIFRTILASSVLLVYPRHCLYSEQYLLLQFYLCTPDIVYIQNNTFFFSFTCVPQTLFIFRTILASSVLLVYPRHCLYSEQYLLLQFYLCTPDIVYIQNNTFFFSFTCVPQTLFIFRTILASSVLLVYPRHCLYSEQYLLLQFYLCTPDIVYIQNNTCFFSFTCVPQTLFIFRTILSSSVLLVYPRHCLYSEQYFLLQFYLCTPNIVYIQNNTCFFSFTCVPQTLFIFRTILASSVLLVYPRHCLYSEQYFLLQFYLCTPDIVYIQNNTFFFSFTCVPQTLSILRTILASSVLLVYPRHCLYSEQYLLLPFYLCTPDIVYIQNNTCFFSFTCVPQTLFIFRTILSSSVLLVYPRHCLYSEPYLLLQFYLCTPDIVYIQNNTCFFSFTCVPQTLFIFRTILSSSVLLVYPRHCLYSEQYFLLQFYLCTPDIVYIQNNTFFFSFTCVPQTLFIFRTILSSLVLLVYPRYCLYSEQYLLLQFYLCTPDIVYIQNNTCFFSFTCVPQTLFIFRTILSSSVLLVYPRHCLYSEQYFLLQFYLCTPNIVYIQNITCFFSFTCVPQTLFIFRTILASSVLLVYPRHCLYSEQYFLLQFYLCTPDIVYIQNNTCFFSFSCVPQTLFIFRTILASSVLLVYPRHCLYSEQYFLLQFYLCTPDIVYIQNHTCFFSFTCVPQTLFIFRTILASSVLLVYPRHCLYSEQYLLLQFYLCTPDIVYIQNNTFFFSFTCVPQTLFIFRTILSSSVLLVYPRHCLYSEQYFLLQFYLCTPEIVYIQNNTCFFSFTCVPQTLFIFRTIIASSVLLVYPRHCLYSEQYLLLQFYLCTPDIVYIQNNTFFFSFTCVPQTLFIFRTIIASSVLLVYPRHCLYSEQYLLLQFYLCNPDIVYIQNNTFFFSFTCVPQILFIFRTILASSVLLVYPRHCLYSEQYLLLQFYLCTPDIVYIQNNTCFFSFTCVPQIIELFPHFFGSFLFSSILSEK